MNFRVLAAFKGHFLAFLGLVSICSANLAMGAPFNPQEMQRIIQERRLELDSLIDELAGQLAPYKLSKDDLEYIALEVLYNIPTRRALFQKKVDEVYVEKIPGQADVERPGDLMVGVNISGHDSKLVWRRGAPYSTYIIKPVTPNRRSTVITELLINNKQGVDFLPEFDDFIYEKDLYIKRPRHSFYYKPGEKDLPLHGFFSSPYLYELALKRNKSVEEFLETDFVEELADFIFKVWFKLGLITDSHTQNLRIIISSDGRFHFALKDFTGIHFHRVFADFKNSYRGVNDNVGGLLNNISQLNPINANGAVDNPKSREIGYKFATYLYQTLTQGTEMSFNQKSRMVKNFFIALIKNLERHHNIKITFSNEIQNYFEKLELIQNPTEIKLRVPSGRYPYEMNSQLGAFAELAMNELAWELYDKVYFVKKRLPVSTAFKKVLDNLFSPKSDAQRHLVRLMPTTVAPFSKLPHPDSKFEEELIRIDARQDLYNRESEKLIKRNAVAKYQFDDTNLYRIDTTTGRIWEYLPLKYAPKYIKDQLMNACEILMSTTEGEHEKK